MTKEEALLEFLNGFEGSEGNRDGKVTLDEWVKYYEEVSVSIDSVRVCCASSCESRHARKYMLPHVLPVFVPPPLRTPYDVRRPPTRRMITLAQCWRGRGLTSKGAAPMARVGLWSSSLPRRTSIVSRNCSARTCAQPPAHAAVDGCH